MKVVDLHCDLLYYLALHSDRTPHDPEVPCSIPQLQKGGVALQVTAIFTETHPHSLLLGLTQLARFHQLPKHESLRFLPAFENASSFCLESEPLSHVLARLESILRQITPLYIGLTWNGENRFGGGIGAEAGLKADGKELLRYLSGKGIAIDFSHASDRLSGEMLNFIDQEKLALRVMASHCNFRAIENHPRNLPDEIAKEIFARNGIMGLVFYTLFLKSPDQLIEQIEHGLSLGGENSLAFGADYFAQIDFPDLHGGGFFPEMNNSSKYPYVLEKLKQTGRLSQDQIEKIASKNAWGFIHQAAAGAPRVSA